MKLTSIQITKLFDLFDYDIKFKDNEPVLILTGANGFGKTMILNIVYNLFNKKFHFFYTLIFDTITINLDNDTQIIVVKKEDELRFEFKQEGEVVGEVDYYTKEQTFHLKELEASNYIRKISPDTWLDHKSNKKIFRTEVLIQYMDKYLYDVLNDFGSDALSILNSIKVYLIKEQRLLRFTNKTNLADDEEESMLVFETIQTHANELKEVILEAVQKSFNQMQALNSSYLDRLIDEQGLITEDDYNPRLHRLNAKQERLVSFGLDETKREFRKYSEADAKAVLVYIKDQEAILAEFDALLAKLDLFTATLNTRRFTYKSIKISKQKGFFFTTNKGKELPLNALSSGEQHEVILLYELIFNVQPNTLVLIDEPEISLHITWQKQFLKDLFRIVEIQDIQILVATHAPAIIKGRWDLVYSLDGIKEDDE